MMKMTMKYIQILFILVFYQVATAQKDVTEFLNYGLGNAKVLSEQYLMPQSKMVENSFSNGWFATAKVHKFGGIDIQAGVNYVFVSAGDLLFNVKDMVDAGALPGITLADGSVTQAPTVSNEFLQGQGRPQLIYDGVTTEMPNGSGYSSMLSPIVGVTIGISLNTEIAFRYMLPNGDSNSGDVTMYGVALKHSLKNYLPFVRRTPYLQLALTGNYSSYKSSLDVSYNSQPGQELNADATGYGGGMIIGMDFPVFGFMGSVGYATSESTFTLDGTFSDIPGEADILSPELATYSNGYINYGAGMFFRLYRFRISANYSYGLYSMLSAQIAFEIGN